MMSVVPGRNSCAFALFCLLAGAGNLAGQDKALASSLAALRREAMRYGNAKIAVQVQLVDEKRPCFTALARTAFIPASNMKIFTAALLLARLGPKYEFHTRFYLHEEEKGMALRVVPGGDPCLGEERDPIQGLIDKLRAAKVLDLGAGVYLDDRAWPGPARPSGWPKDQLQFYYAAPTGAFAIEEGCILVRLDPGRLRSGACPVELGPGCLQLPQRGEIKISTNKKLQNKIGAVHDAKGLRLFGRIMAGSSSLTLAVSAHDCKAVYARYLWCRLKEAGIQLSSFRLTKPRSKGRLLHTRNSPLSLALLRILRHSSNFTAEQCLRIAAFEDNGEGSLLAARKLLQKQFSPGPARASEWYVADGSGLSRASRISAALMCKLLCDVWAADYRNDFLAALPANGEDGKLSKRMKQKELEGRVRAKTGWIRGVSSLSGFVRCKSGKTAAFSILINYDRKEGGLNRHFKRIQDQMVRAIYASF